MMIKEKKTRLLMKTYAQKLNDRNDIAILINSLEKDYGTVGQFLKWCNAMFNTW